MKKFLLPRLFFSLIAVLTATTAWATKVNVGYQTYVAGELKTRYVDATVLTGSETTIPWGWYVVNSDIQFNHTVQFSGNVYIILADGCKMTMGSTQNRLGTFGLYGSDGTISDNYGTDYELYIYGQSGQSGRLEIYSSTTKSNVSGIKVKSLFMYGGNIDLNGYNGINTRGYWDGYVIINNGNVAFTSTKNYGKGIDSYYFRMSGGTFYAYGLANYAVYSHDFEMSGGWLSIVDFGGIYCFKNDYDQNGTFLMTGGNLSVNGTGKGIYAPTITLGLTKDGDQITANNYYESTVKVETGKILMDNNDHSILYSGTLTDDQKTAIKGKTLVPAKFDGTGTAQDPYVIHTAKGWDTFCEMFGTSAAPNDFNNVYVKLGNDISVTTMAGTSEHPFKGHFDGGGHTMTVNYNVDNEDYIAPFRYVDGATIEKLNIEGTIYASAMKAGGLIGEGTFNTTTITNCRVSATITGGNQTGGLISSGKVDIDHCVFNGKFNNSYYHGGFIGHNNSSDSRIANSLFDPQSESNYSNTFYYYYSGIPAPTIENCYYTTQAVADGQAKLAHTITADASANMTLTGTPGVQFGSTVYAKCGHTNGVSDETISLTLADPGTDLNGYGTTGTYKPTAGHLNHGAGTSYTLYMPAENIDVVISAFSPIVYDITYHLNDGSWGGIVPPENYTIESDDVMLPAPTKAGNSFMGWYNNPGLTGDPVSCIPAGSYGDKVFYAKWEAIRTKKSLLDCTAEVPNQTLTAHDTKYNSERTYNKISNKFEEVNNSPTSDYDVSLSIVEKVYDGDTKLTLGTDYYFGSVTYQDPNRTPEYMFNTENDKPGDECLVEIIGMGDYDGTVYAPFTIIPESGGGTWGALTWFLSESNPYTLFITPTTPGSSVAMQKANNNDGYPWYSVASSISAISIGEGVLNVADKAFAGTSNENPYAGVTTVSLPSTLTGYDNEGTWTPSIGDNAFSYCTGATITIPTCATTFGRTTPFNEVGCVVGTFSDTGDNNAIINAMYLSKSANVTLQDRTLYKDNQWNTLCLPFDMTNAQVTEQLAPYALMELDVEKYYDSNNIPYEKRDDGKYYNGSTAYSGSTPLHQTGFDATSGTLYLYFQDATSIVAGKPYIIKWDNGDALVNPVFTGVKIKDNVLTTVTSKDNGESTGYVSFVGTYKSETYDITDNADVLDAYKSILFLGGNSSLYYPNGTAPTTINAFRAYFTLNNGLTAGESTDPNVSNVRAFVLNFGDEEAQGISDAPRLNDKGEMINDKEAGAWYSLDGRKLDGKPTHKGLYINKGVKVVIK